MWCPYHSCKAWHTTLVETRNDNFYMVFYMVPSHISQIQNIPIPYKCLRVSVLLITLYKIFTLHYSTLQYARYVQCMLFSSPNPTSSHCITQLCNAHDQPKVWLKVPPCKSESKSHFCNAHDYRPLGE